MISQQTWAAVIAVHQRTTGTIKYFIPSFFFNPKYLFRGSLWAQWCTILGGLLRQFFWSLFWRICGSCHTTTSFFLFLKILFRESCLLLLEHHLHEGLLVCIVFGFDSSLGTPLIGWEWGGAIVGCSGVLIGYQITKGGFKRHTYK